MVLVCFSVLHRHPPGCLYANILEFVNAKVKDRLEKNHHKLTMMQFLAQLRTGNLCEDAAYCQVHKRRCKLTRTKLHVAGPPCIDWSSQWSKAGKRFGKTFVCTLAWYALMVLLLPELIIHENVEAYDVTILQTFLAAEYCVHTAVFCASTFGWPVRRVRRITMCLRLDLLLQVVHPWTEFIASCHRVSGISWKAFAMNTVGLQSELQDELAWARGRKASLYNADDADLRGVLAAECQPWGISVSGVLALVNESIWTRALIASEARRLFMYRELNSNRGYSQEFMVCCPGQDPLTHPFLSGTQAMGAIISSSSVVWADGLAEPRWLVPSELLLTQGFVSQPEHHSIAGFSTPFSRWRPGRQRQHVLSQAGNSMNVQVMGHLIVITFLNFLNRNHLLTLLL